ncbi:MAG: 16S rRNA (cytosine(967)-C(5))-methyltransferase RsmB [bacterium]
MAAKNRNLKKVASSLTKAVLNRSLFINEFLTTSLPLFNCSQKSFITELVYGTVRNLEHMDFWILQAFKKPLKRIDEELLSIVRISLYQIIFMSNREAPLIVNEATELAKTSCGDKGGKFVNFILREILRINPSKENMEKNLKDDREKFLQTYYSIPEWLYKKIEFFTGKERLEPLLEVINKPLGITLRIEGDEKTREKVISHLISNGAEAEKAKDSPFGIYTTRAVNYDLVKGLEGVYIQDESSQLAVLDMGIEKGDQILDLCAAPGGKTLFCSFLTGEKGKVVSVDINRHRLSLLTETILKHKKKNIEVKLHDSSTPKNEWNGQFDKVLVDAPCSALGTIRRHPEMKWLKKSCDSEKMAVLAGRILERAANYVKQNGILLFSVCTFTKEETTEQIQKFIAAHKSFKIEKNYYTVSNVYDNRDIFFICKMRKVK